MYTIEKHVEGLYSILETNDPCLHCPAYLWRLKIDYDKVGEACKICRSFIGLQTSDPFLHCPCHELGKKEAIKLTWLALEKKGYS